MLAKCVVRCHITVMSKQLLKLMQDCAAKDRYETVARLMRVTKRQEMAISRWIDGKSTPPKSLHYAIAIECGCSDTKALALASGDLPRAKTA